MDTDRCEAAHPEDPTACVGDHHAVRILDAQNYEAWGCEHHATRLLASLDGAKVFPGNVGGAAIRVSAAADWTRPFPWLTNAPRTEASQLSHKEGREQSEREAKKNT
ncbi:hypothetical protein ACFPA8_27500 [Streptomyces ovatisporus]|uniref:Uncharacterized protein n=1 Tax=Streptomyces ovatisporus TaxID=1128682 RepID=A0ABV9AEK0_9ACTN